MTKIGVLSDTHGSLNPKIVDFLSECQEIWHAGDIGSLDIIDKLKTNKTLRAVFGNIDDARLRSETSDMIRFNCEGFDILITHIAGTPSRYDNKIKKIMALKSPNILVCGHSHILKIFFDKKNDCLFINPGAAGEYGNHIVKTALRFDLDNKDIKNMEILEIQK